MKVTVIFLFICVGTLVFPGKTNAAISEAQALDIAKTRAPTIHQGLGSDPSADEFTRVDFDGDWNVENNWENQPKHPRPPAVYYYVLETATAYLITYAFYYPRDYATFCFWIHCHENDFEGARITVSKHTGETLKIEGLAHNYRSVVLNPKSVELVIESGGHGVHPIGLRQLEGKSKTYVPGSYALIPLSDLWDKRKKIFTGSFQYGARTLPANFKGNKWILFGFGAAKPAWSWEVWDSDLKKGEWFLGPAGENSIKAFFK